MIPELVEPRPWQPRRWGAIIALILGVQLGLMFWLGSTVPMRPRPGGAALTLHLAVQASADLWALNAPTLFTLPHPEGFSGPVWLRRPQPEIRAFEWSVPPHHVVLALDQLGTVFKPLAEANNFTAIRLPAQPEAAPTLPGLPPMALSADQSVLQLEGGLARRHLLTPLQMKSQPHPEILANSVVQVVVDDEGRPVSVTLLAGSGSAAADQDALEQARIARFERVSYEPAEAVPNPMAHLSWGKMIFQWHTVPMPPASGPAANP